MHNHVASLTYVSSLPRDSLETFRLTRQTSRLKSRSHQNDGGNLASYHITSNAMFDDVWILLKQLFLKPEWALSQ